MGEEWLSKDKHDGLNLPRKTSRFVALSAFNFLSRHHKKHMREPMSHCTTLRQNLVAQRREPPAKSFDLSKSYNEECSFQKLFRKPDQNDDSILVFDHLA